MANTKIVTFILPLESYALGDTACFDEKIADKLIEGKYATEVTLESTKLEKPKKNPEDK
jgi:hypothetical protein